MTAKTPSPDAASAFELASVEGLRIGSGALVLIAKDEYGEGEEAGLAARGAIALAPRCGNTVSALCQAPPSDFRTSVSATTLLEFTHPSSSVYEIGPCC